MIDRPGERSADSVTVNNNSPIQDWVHPDDHTQPIIMNAVMSIFFTEMKLVKCKLQW